MKSAAKTRAERLAEWKAERDKPCECRTCHALKYEHVDVHLKNNQPSQHCYQCRTDFVKELKLNSYVI